MKKIYFQIVYWLGFIIFIAYFLLSATLFPDFKSIASSQFWFFCGIGHMALLILLALTIEKDYRSESGMDIQYAGYIWTLLGVSFILSNLMGSGSGEKTINIFLNGTGLAIVTSIIGWLGGRPLSMRGALDHTEGVRNAAEAFATRLTAIVDSLEVAGTTLVAAVNDVATKIDAVSGGVSEIQSSLENMNQKITDSSVRMSENLNELSGSFSAISADVKGLEASVQIMGSISNSAQGIVAAMDGLQESYENTLTKTENVTKTIEKMQTQMSDVIDQGQQLMEKTGKFIDTVFNKKLNRNN